MPRDLSLYRHLRTGGIIAYATESCFGLGCDPMNRRAVQRILRLKGRPQAKGLILIATDLAQLQPYLAPLPAGLDVAAYWPGPTTLLLPASRRCPRWLTGKHQTIAVRVTAHPDARQTCQLAAMALVSTSANRSGQRPLRSAAACHALFGDTVLVLPGRTGTRRRPSTVLNPLSGRVVRQ